MLSPQSPLRTSPNGKPSTPSIKKLAWHPQTGPQAALVKCPADEIFYGGARGGGKTDGMLGKFAIKAQRYGSHCVGVFFRRTREDLKEAIERSKQIYGPIGANWVEQKKWWTFPNGARLKFEYLDRDADANNYQGHNYTDVFFEELTHWGDPTPVNKLRATLRSAEGVPCQFHATGNPGGPGHQWVRARYIDPEPLGHKVLWEDFENPFTGEKIRKNRVFIPSKLSDNKYLGGGYVANLYQSGSEQLVKAWLLGDWSVIEGAFFDCWSNEKHVVRPFAIPSDWLRFRSVDWGSAKPFSVGWWAVAGDDYPISGMDVCIPRGALVRYREWYGCVTGQPNTGLKLTAEEVAQGIALRDGKDDITYSVMDPAAFTADGGPSIAERMAKATNGKVLCRRADNRRVAQHGAIGGWDQVRARLKGDPDGRPMIYFFSTCADTIRTVPALQHDNDRPEDVDTDGEDHAGDEVRYACMSRPYVREVDRPEDAIKAMLKPKTFDAMIAEYESERAEE
jgi:hypothetical protein